jgi:hypothetical protein
VLLGAIMALAACGTTASPSASVKASAVTEPASQPPDVLAVVCAPASKPFDPSHIDLTGAWAGDDGGIYYLRQLGSVVWWNGMSGRDASPLNLGRDWNNVGRGVINGLQIEVEWTDLPRTTMYGNGTLLLKIQDDGTGNVQIVKVDGDFGNEFWTPCLPVEQEVAHYVETYGGDVRQFADILSFYACDGLAELKGDVTTTLNTADAGSAEFRAALGYSNAIKERELVLDC